MAERLIKSDSVSYLRTTLAEYRYRKYSFFRIVCQNFQSIFFFSNYSHYRNRFSMPGKTDNMYYSFDIGPVHFIALNTETYYNNTHYNVEIYPVYE